MAKPPRHQCRTRANQKIMEDWKKDQATMKADINQLKDQVNQISKILKNLRTTNDTFPSQSKEQTLSYPPRFYPRTHSNHLVCM